MNRKDRDTPAFAFQAGEGRVQPLTSLFVVPQLREIPWPPSSVSLGPAGVEWGLKPDSTPGGTLFYDNVLSPRGDPSRVVHMSLHVIGRAGCVCCFDLEGTCPRSLREAWVRYLSL